MRIEGGPADFHRSADPGRVLGMRTSILIVLALLLAAPLDADARRRRPKKKPKPRPAPAASVPGLLGLLQAEWDAVALEAHSLPEASGRWGG